MTPIAEDSPVLRAMSNQLADAVERVEGLEVRQVGVGVDERPRVRLGGRRRPAPEEPQRHRESGEGEPTLHEPRVAEGRPTVKPSGQGR